MAKIISYAKEKGYRAKCKTCKTIFEFSHQETARGIATGRLLTVCPYCNKIVYYSPFSWKKVKIL